MRHVFVTPVKVDRACGSWLGVQTWTCSVCTGVQDRPAGAREAVISLGAALAIRLASLQFMQSKFISESVRPLALTGGGPSAL